MEERKKERERKSRSGRKEEHARWKQGQETRARLVSSPPSVTEKEEGRNRVEDAVERSDRRRTQKNDFSPSAKMREEDRRPAGVTRTRATRREHGTKATKGPQNNRRNPRSARVITVLIPSGADVL